MTIRKQRTLTIDYPADRVFPAVVSVLEMMEFNLKHTDQQGHVQAEKRALMVMPLKFDVYVTPEATNVTRVDVNSALGLAVTIGDSTETSRKTLDEFEAQLRNLLARDYGTVVRPAAQLTPTYEPHPIPERPSSSHTIFISYRRADSADICGRIYDRLVGYFGPDAIFKDVDSIPLGVDFKAHIEKTIEQCTAVLVIIGQQWATTTDEKGRRRLDNPGDYVRIEIEVALQRPIPVIPLLVQGASMPDPGELPPNLEGLALRNGLPVRSDPDFHNDMNRLIKGLEGEI
jgi:hypothetical protein